MMYKKICPICNKEFETNSARRIYCYDDHYMNCPMCGEPVKIGLNNYTKYLRQGAPHCSKCKYIAESNTINSKTPEQKQMALEKRKQTNLAKFGTEWASQNSEIQKKVVATNMSRYGVARPLQNIDIYTTMLESNKQKYGESMVSRIPEFKQKTVQKLKLQASALKLKRCNTILERYGVDNPMKSDVFKAKLQNTNIERYGVPYNLQCPEILAKVKATNQMRYGGDSPMASPVVREKQKAAIRAKYGVDYASQIPGVTDKIRTTCLARYGVDFACMRDEARHGLTHCSKVNLAFAELLSSVGIDYTVERKLGSKWYDICIDTTVVEIDPTITHNSYKSLWSNQLPTPPNYHLMKSQIAQENGYRCIHVFDWDDWSRILTLLKPKQTLYARNCEIREVDILSTIWFENHNHLQGSVRKQIYRYGLYYNNELVQLMTFGAPRYNKNYEWELLRLCTHIDYRVVGGASKLFKHFIAECSPSSIISYCDKAKFTGGVYTAIGMWLDHVSTPAKHWSKSTEHITDNLLRQRGYDQLFGTEYGKGTSNEQLMLDNGWLPVYDCGQAVYVWRK